MLPNTRTKPNQTIEKKEDPNLPRRIIVAKGSYFQKASQGDTPFGLILPNFTDLRGCFDQAERDTKEIGIQDTARKQEFYNLALATYLVGCCTTDPSDHRKAHFVLGGDSVRSSLNKEGIKHVYRELEVYAQSIDPIREPISDKGIDIVCSLVKALPPGEKASKARNILAYLADIIAD